MANLAALLATVPMLIGGPYGPVLHVTQQIGHSADGRRIMATESGAPQSPHRVLVVGCIHGNECAGIAVVRRLRRLPPPRTIDLWLVPTLNPDGRAADTRQNGHGVDLNRNFGAGGRRTARRGAPTTPGRGRSRSPRRAPPGA